MRSLSRKIFLLLPKGDRLRIGLLIAMMLIASLLSLLGVGMIPVFVLTVINPDYILEMPVVGELLSSLNITTTERLVVVGALFLLFVFAAKNVYMIYYDYVKTKYMLHRKVYIQNRLFRAYMSSPYLLFLSRNSSELIRNIDGESTRVMDGVLKPALDITLNGMMTLMIIVALIYVEPFISGMGILLFGGGSYIFLRSSRSKMRSFGSKALHHRHLKMKALMQGLGGFKDVKVLNREWYFLKDFDTNIRKILKYDLWNTIFRALPVHIIELLALSGVLFIAVTMILQGRSADAIVPVIALFGAAVMRLKPSIFSLIEGVNSLHYNTHSIDTILTDLHKLENQKGSTLPPPGKKGNAERLEIRDHLELKNVAFKYPGNSDYAVENINIRIPKNHAVAFVGASGAGKTTLADVILGLLKPQRGEIRVDGVDIFDDIRKWQHNIGYIPQDIYLLDEPIRNNICFGVEEHEIDEEQLKMVIETAQLSDLIRSLPEGVDTLVGERGVRLSGGQRQRIGIARALYHDPQLIIMDEATSALDNITEKYLIHAIEQLKGEKTIIMIAHRLTTVQKCDTIYLMEGAEIIAAGPYSHLLENSPEFREMSLIGDETSADLFEPEG